jgi:hypothetical protein
MLGVHPDRVRKQEGIITKAKYGVKGKRGESFRCEAKSNNAVNMGIFKHPGGSATRF